MWINRQLRLRRERKIYLEENPFCFNDDEEWERHDKTKGVLLTTEYGEEGIATLHATWSEAYPDLRIETVYSGNADTKKDLLETLSSTQAYSDIDMLITSPSWSTGINIVDEFDLTVGDFAKKPEAPLTPEEIF